MSDNGKEVRDLLEQLQCHFTWKLLIEDTEVSDLENRVLDEIEFLDKKFNTKIHNLLAYVKHLKGENKEALQSLKEAEDLIQTEQDDQLDVRSLVTWGNYAWLHYHMGRLAEAQMYLDKVKNTCRKFASPSCYTVESPEMDCEEGWALLKCGGKNYEWAKACFEKAVEADPENPEFNTGYAITVYRLNGFNRVSRTDEAFCLHLLQQAVKLNPEDAYIKALLALKLQDMGREAEGEKHMEDALRSLSSQTYVFRYAAKFYRRKGFVDEAVSYLKMALQATPSSALVHHQLGICYRSQINQIKKATNRQPRGQDRGTIHQLLQLALWEFEEALRLKPTFHMVYISLAETYAEIGRHREAEDTFQKLLCKRVSNDYLQQEMHYCYGRFQEYHKKSEVKAVIRYLKAIKIDNSSITGMKSCSALEKLVSRKLQRNAADIESLSILGFLYKLRGEMDTALEYYERALSLAAG